MTNYIISFDARYDSHPVSYINEDGRGFNGTVWATTPETCIIAQMEKARDHGWEVGRIEVHGSGLTRKLLATHGA